MGRNEDRQTAKFNFNNYKIEMYRPTQGQGAAITISGKQAESGKDPMAIVRFFKIIESLVVSAENWAAMDDALVTGDVDLDVFMDLVQGVFSFDWDGDAAKKRQLAQQMRDKVTETTDA